MELSEATTLADKFITRAVFKVHSLPLHEHSKYAALWWRNRGSNISVGKTLQEERRHLRQFSIRDEVDRRKDRSLHLTLSALTVDLDEGRCPALSGSRCGIYTSRPLTCRTVPMHYSRPISALHSYLTSFVETPGYLCNTSPDAPVVLEGDTVCDMDLQQARRRALELVRDERRWKRQLVRLMENADSARAAGLPTFETVLQNSEQNLATSVSMIVVWRLARNFGTLAPAQFAEACVKQRRLLRCAIGRTLDKRLLNVLHGMLSEYESELANIGQSVLSRVSVFRLIHKLRAARTAQ